MRNRNASMFALLTVLGSAAAGAAPPPDLDEAELGAPLEPAATPQARKAQMLARAKSLRSSAPDKARDTKLVDCAQGDSLQRAIDRHKETSIFEVRGLCNENVRVERRKLTLHGLNPATDGIRGVTADPAAAALELWYSELVIIENLSISHSGGGGLGMWYSGAAVRNCHMTGNAGAGIHVSLASFLNGTELTLSNNGGAGLNVQASSLAFCLGCRLENNATWAAIARRGGLLSVLDSVVTGVRGIQAVISAYADIDCVTEDTSYPCSLNVTRTAAFASGGATAAMYGAGPFAGQLFASDQGQLYVFGAQQTSTGMGPSGNPLVNGAERFSMLLAEPYIDAANTAHQSQLAGSTQITTFSRALLFDATTAGNLSCASAGDTWKDAGVTGTLTGCEHAP
jgi:hypothetical protein